MIWRQAHWSCWIISLIIANLAFASQFWQSFTSMSDPRDLEYFQGKIWGATEGGIFGFDLNDSSFQLLSTAEGLRGNEFRCSAVDSTGKVWASGIGATMNIYNPDNGSIIVLSFLEGEVDQITDLAIEGTSVYTATSDGIYEFYYEGLYDEYFVRGGYFQLGNFPLNCSALAVFTFEGYLWVGTEYGVARIELSVQNKQQPDNWQNFTTANGLPSNTIIDFAVKNDTLIAASKYQSLAKFNGSGFQVIPVITPIEVKQIQVLQDTIYSATIGGVKKLAGNTWVEIGPGLGKAYSLVAISPDSIWSAKANSLDQRGGLCGFSPSTNWNLLPTNTPSGKYINALMVASDGKLWCGGGSPVGKGVYVYDGFNWLNYTPQDSAYDLYFYNHPQGEGDGPSSLLEYPNGEVWVGSFGSGIAVIEPDGSQLYFSSMAEFSQDSIARLAGIDEDEDYCVVGDLVLDQDNNVWLVNRQSSVDKPLLMVPFEFMEEHSPQIEWLDFSASDLGILGSTDPYFDYLVLDHYNRLWMGGDSPDATGLYCLDFNSTPYNQNDDLCLHFGSNNGLLDNTIYDLEIDQEGWLWIATSLGLNYFEVPEVMNSASGIQLQSIYFMEGVKVNCIGIDAMNNRWLGTDNGLFLLSVDNYTILEIYNQESFPLPDDKILDLAFNNSTGEVFIATPNGIASILTPYRDFPQTLGNLGLYPVPFYPDGENLLRFGPQGLTPDAEIKVFTHSGLLVRKLSFLEASLGWNGKNNQGDLVGSGIYLILVTSPDGQSECAKAAVIRR